MNQIKDNEKTTDERDWDMIWKHYQNINPESFDGAKARLDHIIKDISRRKNASIPRVLNIGVGNGYLEKKMQKLGWKVFSLDPDEKTIKRLVDIGIQAEQGYIEKMPFEASSVDFVVASEVLEHLDRA